ncbi:hypothetical protein FOA52_010201 [Chlamydomonas sp. UWO 241]|nr:hypothetical protein FOA52_010201 [Chlamydomonas sp. UWO 241]
MNKSSTIGRGMSLVLLLAVMALLAAGGAQAGRGRGSDTPCLLLDAEVCPGNHTRTCANTVGDVVCIHNNATDCPAPADLDAVEKECGMHARPHACALPVDATECPGNNTLSCKNTAGDIICVNDKNATECPAPAELSDVERECGNCTKAEGGKSTGKPRGGRGMLQADAIKERVRDSLSASKTPCLLLDAEVCPGNHSLTCANTMGDVVCIHSNATDCPAPADLDAVEKECGMHARPHACALPVDATECPGPANHTLSCKNTAGDIICVDDKNATECPAAADLDEVDKECRGPPPAHMHACALPANATVCPGPANHTLSCKNTASDVICVEDKSATECPAAADLDDFERECSNSTSTDRPAAERPNHPELAGRATAIVEHVRGGPRNRRMML